MDLIHKLLNFFLPGLSITLFIFLLPAILFFSLLKFCIRYVFTEKLAGKVVLITGASSGIGECLAYEYGKRGACLALIARRKEQLQMVAEKAKKLGSPDVVAISADVSKPEDCKRFVDEAVDHFGRLDHLINNAGIAILRPLDDQRCASNYASVMDINFWGSVYTTQFAIPHLRKSKGKIAVISSTGGWFGMPRLSIYNASKAALVSYFETLRIELGSDVKITVVTPGMVKSSITNSQWLSEANLKGIPLESTEGCAKAIVNSTCRGDNYLTEPAWMKVVFLWKLVCPEILNWTTRFLFITWPKLSSRNRPSCSMESIQSPEFKSE